MSSALMPPKVAIVGGGLAGLSAAFWLAKLAQGLPTDKRPIISLYEGRTKLGGRAGAFIDAETGGALDLCQHVSLGCCHEFVELFREIGAAEDFSRERTLHFCSPDFRWAKLEATPWLPAPLHLLSSFCKISYLTWYEKWKIFRALILLRYFVSETDDGRTTMGDFLDAQRMPLNPRTMFWEPVVVSALSESLERASLSAARKVFVEAFMQSRNGYEMFVPRRPLCAILHERMLPWLVNLGVKVQLAATVRFIGVLDQNITREKVTQIQFADQSCEDYEAVIVAVPWNRVAGLFDAQTLGQLPEIAKLAGLEATPIVSVHLWYDRQLTDLSHVVLPGRMSQWLFIPEQAVNEEKAVLHQVVISAAQELAKLPREEIKQCVEQELRATFSTNAANLIRWQVVIEPRAVFAPLPGSGKFRPATRSSIDNLFWAGDWTDTGWPATMESAVISGRLAAEACINRIRKLD